MDQTPDTQSAPYPRQYAGTWHMRDGRPLAIRPIRPDDEPLMVGFHQTLSEQTVYGRYAQVLPLGQRILHERLMRRCTIDYVNELALVAIDESLSSPLLVAVGRLIRLKDGADAEFAIVVSDAYQHQGVGGELLRRLIEIGREMKLQRLIGYIVPTNQAMLRACTRLDFQCRPLDDHTQLAVLWL